MHILLLCLYSACYSSQYGREKVGRHLSCVSVQALTTCRYADNKDLGRMMKEREREGDPSWLSSGPDESQQGSPEEGANSILWNTGIALDHEYH